jgi:HAD superfamily hydrolase (TIGR01490 family)
MSRIVLFDLDGTLVRTNTAALYIRYEFGLGRASLAKVLSVVGWQLQYAVGYIDAHAVATRGLAWYRGRGDEELRADMQVWFAQSVRPQIPDAARTAVAAHLAAGDRIAIATGATAYIADLVAEELGIPTALCSEVGVADGRLSGTLIPPLCYGAGKVERVQRWLRQIGHSGGAQGLVAYTDSITDLPLLEAVETPIVVNPDLRLWVTARKRGWRVEKW